MSVYFRAIFFTTGKSAGPIKSLLQRKTGFLTGNQNHASRLKNTRNLVGRRSLCPH